MSLSDQELDQVLRGVPVQGRPTPQTLVEAVMFSVREGGLGVLKEPATQERLLRCDEAARAQINERIDKLMAAGRIPQGEANA